MSPWVKQDMGDWKCIWREGGREGVDIFFFWGGGGGEAEIIMSMEGPSQSVKILQMHGSRDV